MALPLVSLEVLYTGALSRLELQLSSERSDTRVPRTQHTNLLAFAGTWLLYPSLCCVEGPMSRSRTSGVSEGKKDLLLASNNDIYLWCAKSQQWLH